MDGDGLRGLPNIQISKRCVGNCTVGVTQERDWWCEIAGLGGKGSAGLWVDRAVRDVELEAQQTAAPPVGGGRGCVERVSGAGAGPLRIGVDDTHLGGLIDAVAARSYGIFQLYSCRERADAEHFPNCRISRILTVRSRSQDALWTFAIFNGLRTLG